jgi:hypothetical protein
MNSLKLNIKIVMTVLLAFSIIWGCSTQPEEINVSQLSTACDFIEAQISVCNKILEIAKGRKPEELNDQEKEAVIILNNKFKDIDRAMYKKITIAEAKECDEFKELEALLDGAVDPFI